MNVNTVLTSMVSCLLLLAVTLQSTAAPIPAPPSVAATSYVLIDYASGQVLSEKDSNKRVEPASLTKIMTAYVAFSSIKGGFANLEDLVTISERAWKMGGSRMFIEVGKKIRLQDLLKGMIVQSGNDASVAIAEHIAGTEEAFAEQMNAYAKHLGMNGTHYANSTGWPNPDQYTTAKDLAVLTRALIRNFPEYYAWHSEREFSWNNIKQYNRNKLLWRDDSVDGVKTGHTESAGYGLVASAKRKDMRLISVMLGTKSEAARARASQSQLNYGFRYYESRKLYRKGEKLSDVRIWKGETNTLSLGVNKDIHVATPRGDYKKLKADLQIPGTIVAPVNKGETLGTYRVTLDGKALLEEPLIALATIREGSIWRRTVDSLRLMFE